MDRKIFNAYLKYQKDNKLTFWPFLNRQKPLIKTIFWTSFAFLIIGSSLCFFRLTIVWGIIIMALSLISCAVLYLVLDYYQIKESQVSYVEYMLYCQTLYSWLTEYGVDNEEKVRNLQDRIDNRIAKSKDECKDSYARMEKWMQVLIIPIALAVITTIVDKRDDVALMVGAILMILIILLLLYFYANLFVKIGNYPLRRRVSQLECFSADLQGILDTQFANGISYLDKGK